MKEEVKLSLKLQANILPVDKPIHNIIFPKEVIINVLKNEPLKTLVATRGLGVYIGTDISIFDLVGTVTNLYITEDSLYADIESIPTLTGKILNQFQKIAEFEYLPMGTIKVDSNNRVTQLNINGISIKNVKIKT